MNRLLLILLLLNSSSYAIDMNDKQINQLSDELHLPIMIISSVALIIIVYIIIKSFIEAFRMRNSDYKAVKTTDFNGNQSYVFIKKE